MNNANPYARYQQNQVQTANPEKLILMLYDGAIKFLGQAKTALAEKDIEKTNHFLGRTQNIIAELMSSLDMDYEVSKSLFSLYDFMHHSLVQANIKKDLELVEEVQLMLLDLRDTWAQAMLLAKGNTKKVVNGVNFSG